MTYQTHWREAFRRSPWGAGILGLAVLLMAASLPSGLWAQDEGDDQDGGSWGDNPPPPQATGHFNSTAELGTPDTTCGDGVVVDDGTTDLAYGWVTSVDRGRYVQEFHSSQFPTRDLDSLCVCFRRSQFNQNDDTIDFRVVIYESELAPRDVPIASDRIPADEPLVSVAATGSGVPIGTNGAFFEVPVNGARIPTGTFYLGVEWDARSDRFFHLCADTNPDTPPVNAFFRETLFESWSSLFKSNDSIFESYKAFMVRAVPNTEEVVDVPTLDRRAGIALMLGLIAAACWRLRGMRAG